MRTSVAPRILLALAGASILLAIAWESLAAPGASPKIANVRKIYVDSLWVIGHKHGKVVHVEHGSQKEVQKRIVSAIASSGRFSAVEKEADADAKLEGSAGFIRSEEGGKKFTTGFAELKLVDLRSKEILWVFDYKPKSGAGGKAADRVADQFIESLLADAKSAAGQ
jgi:hypothetical protein